ncbi:sodium/potassium/calcium exchanger 4-like isoform X2 [Condylostylus longicornis]|uniref:sodium/potassium/calcium exchanger 4-like isoform X2 n=1 Tax=Condylostylus longicornis TaxID=2530218 RepID=UPI00244DFE3E|nr:sodium/potassium/calcium exchanger 4-like isoform X2 [Condylostylus longicornis]XP_055388900.1 sodium/potassium/calcium exchanger 4-like isoform X2 [Condylostylus longicornis]XP_055388901.1 sodium/potassium/calcium exchanger 4-like isoform X2 [Condylostylus longicornis]
MTHNALNCTPPAIDDFPKDLFTEAERQSGFVVLHVIASLYLFVALAVVCDEYFVPAVEKICAALNMSNDVAGATFMAAATSAPELFVNVIGTFITEGDIGVGTIVGSAVFNILAVAACCGIGAGMTIPLDWWPLTRDSIAYGITVAILICVMHDERVEWYEALILVSLYGVYIGIMVNDKALQRCARQGVDNAKSRSRSVDSTAQPKTAQGQEIVETEFGTKVEKVEKVDTPQQNGGLNSSSSPPATEPPGEELDYESYSLTHWPKGKCFAKFTWLIIWPIHLLFRFVIPDCKKKRFKKLFPLTFIMCIVWIGSLSYVVAWMITIIGDTLKIPDSVMGITFLAAGTSVPEAVSSVIVAKRGHGSMGICNSIGSNTFDILLCLGVPWLIKAAFSPIEAGQHFVAINSAGLEYSAITLLSTLFLLYITFSLSKFKLDRKVGIACLIMYLVFLIFATLIELNVFFRVNLPTCGL